MKLALALALILLVALTSGHRIRNRLQSDDNDDQLLEKITKIVKETIKDNSNLPEKVHSHLDHHDKIADIEQIIEDSLAKSKQIYFNGDCYTHIEDNCDLIGTE